MILHKTHQEEAILSNVGQVGEFRIRNSAKAFNILSSGLYANKIRAIIRELSCNAVDSHKDAGKPDTPFDIHLPNQLEPWFSIRDYGTGLDHKHLTDIYTTYFESTKTGSNDFIGALGLGSKSPFSYTDNFTVTAIKNGRKGIYTAFINEKGVPSVALMTEEKTDEPAGVEVKFSVNDRYDFQKFHQEAVEVFTYFKLRPVVSGASGFQFKDPKFAEKDIIPGVHYLEDRNGYGHGQSVAIMGNIAYPIEIPEADKSLEKLRDLLSCGLVMEFGIGELDFQASREGLSYIPETIAAIKKKLRALNAQLAIHLAKNADKIANLWERGEYLKQRTEQALWTNAVDKYVKDTKFALAESVVNPQQNQLHSHYRNHYNFLRTFDFTEDDLAKKYNIRIRGFNRSDYRGQIHALKPQSRHDNKLNTYIPFWEFTVDTSHKFVINEGKIGAFRRAKEHFRAEPQSANRNHRNHAVFVIEKFNRDQPLNTKDFFLAMSSPPASTIMDVSALRELERKKSSTANAAILEIEERQVGRWGNRQSHTWVRAGELKDFDDKKTFYYLPLKGFRALGQVEDVKTLRTILRDSKIHTEKVYGVRRSDLDAVKSKKNWINLDKHVEKQLAKLPQKLILSLVKHSLDCESVLQYDIVSSIDANSPYAKLYEVFKSVQKADSRQLHHLERLCQMYKVQMTDDLKKLTVKYKADLAEVSKRYPLLKSISGGYGAKPDHVAEYVNCIDMMHAAKAVKP